MRVELTTYEKVVESFNYLEVQLEKAKLSRETAILYFQTLLNEEENDWIKRPHYTFKLEAFETYLIFFKRFNFIEGCENENTFRISENWKREKVRHLVPASLSKEMLELTETHEELSSCINISA
ncbi:hypothetical protein F6U93_08405 [Tamlana haliotis]|uniref:Uncharacterized protein n=1 Tax=Pseudotamlana haliotis TaxID=2614804 RepID=A0A6N6MIF1_9FLAO|nr:hypothetical protein [Tamlana haliotis]KAB1067953.1 hypothetical protein F6U93_08405 [Tamlana haliotis]